MLNDIIKFLSEKSNYDRYRSYIPKDSLPKEVFDLLAFFRSDYYEQGVLTITDYKNVYVKFSIVNPTYKNLPLIKSLCDSLEATKHVPPSDEVIQLFIDRNTAEEMADYCMKIAEGKGGDFVGVSKMLENYKVVSRRLSKELLERETSDVFSMLSAIKVGGYKWNMDCLNTLFGPLSTEFIIIGSRPDGGKTTFLANEAWYIASQMKDDKCVLWFNNEEHIKNVAKRVVQSSLGVTSDWVVENRLEAYRRYERLIGKDRIKYIDDCTDMSIIERTIERNNPGLIIIDQLYKVKGTGIKSEVDAEKFRQQCAQAREIAKHVAPVLVTNQLDASAEGVRYPTMDCLYGSKTGAQGEADGILFIGKDYAYPDKRYVYSPKNKMTGKTDRFEVNLLKEIARYESL
jgi:hypothetical protein